VWNDGALKTITTNRAIPRTWNKNGNQAKSGLDKLLFVATIANNRLTTIICSLAAHLVEKLAKFFFEHFLRRTARVATQRFF